jgi:iron complex outermembrane receptor protein
MKFNALLVGASVAALAMPATAWAQTEERDAQQSNERRDENDTAMGNEGDIIVTATKRATALQDVPFSINAQTEEDIQRSGAATIEDISRNVAGLTVRISAPARARSPSAASRRARSSAISRASRNRSVSISTNP